MAEALTDKQVIEWILSAREEASIAKRTRMIKNRDNFRMFHLEHDFSHKIEGQSQEILSKQAMAVEQIRSFFQQALVDIGEWWTAECHYPDGEEAMAIRPDEITKLTNYMLENAGYFSHVGNIVQSGLLGALAISKVHGRSIPKPKFEVQTKGRGKAMKKSLMKVEDETWGLKFDVVRQENYYPDPTGEWLYEIEDMWLDLNKVLELAEGDDAIYDRAEVENIGIGSAADQLEEYKKARETGQDVSVSAGHRPQVKLTYFMGSIIDRTTGKIAHKNVCATIANDTWLIQKPEANPHWHQGSIYVKSPLMEVANSVWHKASMDAPTQHNRALIEIYNLLVDAAMKQVHAISQLRKDALDNPAQVSNGIKAGMTLGVNSSLPVGGKVLEPLTAVEIPKDALAVMNVMNQEFNASALTNDLRQGVMPFRAVKATEVVEASQTITSVFQGIAKNFETKQSIPELELAWQTTAQNWSKISKEEFVALFGPKRGAELSQLSPEDVFAATVGGVKFRVFGISLTLSKSQDFRKLTTLLQTIGSSEILMESYAKKYSLDKLLGEVMTALNIDKHKLEIPQEVQATMQPQQPANPGQPAQPDQMSQVPQTGAGSLADMFSGGGPGIPHSQFPGSPATAGQ